MPRLQNGIGIVLLLAACSEDAGDSTGSRAASSIPSGESYREIMAGSGASRVSFDLCQTVRHPMWVGAGLYRVEGLTGVTEKDLGNPPDVGGFTYVELNLVDEWFDAPKHPVARIVGGPYPGGDVGGWDVTLKVGEAVGLFLAEPRERNRDYYGLDELGVFYEDDEGGYSNGMLFTKRHVDANELADLVKGLAGESLDAQCPYNEASDLSAPSQSPSDAGKQQEEDVGPQILPVPADGGSREP